jgi:hypothetical protein
MAGGDGGDGLIDERAEVDIDAVERPGLAVRLGADGAPGASIFGETTP